MLDALFDAAGPTEWLRSMTECLKEKAGDGHDNYTAIALRVSAQ
ncbi:MAG: hypothetical protein ACRD44_18370 [Bryobacteraceae bacterium]